jgi:hypothetical protein
MRFLTLLALTAIIGCRHVPINQSGRVGIISTPRASSRNVKATCERKGKELHVTIPQEQVTGARAVVANQGLVGGMAVNPLALQGGYGPQYRMVPGRTSRALTMGWAALPIPYPKMKKVQIAPTVAMTEGNNSRFMQPNMFGAQRMGMYGMSPYGMNGIGGMPLGAGGVMPVGYAQGMNMQTMQTAQLQQMLAQLQQRQQNGGQSQRSGGGESEETEKVRQRAADLEKKVNQLLDILEKRNAEEDGSAATKGVPAPGHANPQTAANIEQMSGRAPRTAYRTSSDVEQWPHSPQSQLR